MTFAEYEKKGHVGVITMNRPERLNAVGSEMRNDLADAWLEGMNDPEVRVFVLAGKGRIFSAGRDIREQHERGRTGSGVDPEKAKVFGFYGVPDTNKPIIAAVTGGAWGAGWYMVCGSDIAIADEDARFAMSELPTGIIGPPFVPVLQNLPWLPGVEVVLRGHQITARRAYEMGFINHVVPRDQVMTLAMDIAEEIAALPPVHVQVTKEQLIMARPRPSTYQQTIGLPQAMAYLNTLDDTKEAAAAFAEKRKATFKGR